MSLWTPLTFAAVFGDLLAGIYSDLGPLLSLYSAQVSSLGSRLTSPCRKLLFHIWPEVKAGNPQRLIPQINQTPNPYPRLSQSHKWGLDSFQSWLGLTRFSTSIWTFRGLTHRVDQYRVFIVNWSQGLYTQRGNLSCTANEVTDTTTHGKRF